MKKVRYRGNPETIKVLKQILRFVERAIAKEEGGTVQAKHVTTYLPASAYPIPDNSTPYATSSVEVEVLTQQGPPVTLDYGSSVPTLNAVARGSNRAYSTSTIDGIDAGAGFYYQIPGADPVTGLPFSPGDFVDITASYANDTSLTVTITYQ